MGWRFLHWELNLHEGQRVRVNLTDGACVRLMDPPNFELYKSGSRYSFFGGKALKTPLHIRAPHPGKWHLAIDSGKGKYGVNVLDPEPWELGQREDADIEAKTEDVLVRLSEDVLFKVRTIAARKGRTPADIVTEIIVGLAKLEAAREPKRDPGKAPPRPAGRTIAEVARNIRELGATERTGPAPDADAGREGGQDQGQRAGQGGDGAGEA